MTDKIHKLSYDQVLFFDIETVHGEKELTPDSQQYKLWAWLQRNKETNYEPKEKKILQTYYRKAALFPEFGKIVCISVGYIHNENIIIKSLVGEEKEILKSFVNLVQETGRKLCGHNVIEFDLPYIRKRFMINGLTNYLTKAQGNDGSCKSWHLEDNVIDTMAAWKGTGYMNSGLEVLANVFGIPAKQQLHGHQTSEYYYKGKIKELSDYCNSDVWVVANIIRKWKGHDILPLVVKDETVKPLPLLERIYTTGKVEKKDMEELKTIVEGLSKEEKEKGLELLKISFGENSKKKLHKEVIELFN